MIAPNPKEMKIKELNKELTKFCTDNGIEKAKAGYLLGLFMKYNNREYIEQREEKAFEASRNPKFDNHPFTKDDFQDYKNSEEYE